MKLDLICSLKTGRWITFHALDQHLKRTVYQAGHIWGQCLVPSPDLPSQNLWGWNKATNNNTSRPCWSTLPEAARDCQELLKYGCKKACSKRLQVCKSKPTMHKPMLLFGTTYQRFDDLTCIMSFVTYIWWYV